MAGRSAGDAELVANADDRLAHSHGADHKSTPHSRRSKVDAGSSFIDPPYRDECVHDAGGADRQVIGPVGQHVTGQEHIAGSAGP